jgi:hypothetical protein
MNKRGMNIFDIIFAIILLILTVASIILQIFFSSPNSTKIETSLFSIIQFVFSLAFTWLVARISFRNEFQESQKKFAISAYRRIIEISNSVERLINRTISHSGKVDPDKNHELDVITEIGVGIRESIKSSIADWADIIGDEIETLEKIQVIRETQSSDKLDEKLSIDVPNLQEQEQEQKDDIAVENLVSTLPKSLRITAEGVKGDYLSRVRRGTLKFKREEKRKGCIEVEGFYEPPFEIDIYNFKKGDILQVRIGDAGDRIAALIAYDDSGHSVGVIENKLAGIADSYFEGINILIRYLHRSQFQIQITDILDIEIEERHYFRGNILNNGKKMTNNGISK